MKDNLTKFIFLVLIYSLVSIYLLTKLRSINHRSIINTSKESIDWHDYKFIDKEKLRQGIGENGSAAKLPSGLEKLKEELFKENGFNAALSDLISFNRSVPDLRPIKCKTKTYLKQLQPVSVIIPFYNEHPSTLLRTVYSVLNRSPAELIVEIILVDDYSNKQFLGAPLKDFIKDHLPKVKLIRLPERSGLITARLTGARNSSAEVLVFLDSHTEANVNWLPPLLEPIAKNYKICVCPFIDVIDSETFNYLAQDDGARGAFDWTFSYKRLPLLPTSDPSELFESPIMAGGLFAISSKFFWELGGYDEDLDIWGGEQYELSFKIWQCGGRMYDAPCSRVGHVFRGELDVDSPREYDFVSKNYKRVAEVWMDDYKKYLYQRDPETYLKIDPGDLSKQKAIRDNLKCKSFKWFLEEIAFDIPIKYPFLEPPDYASGSITSIKYPNLCIDTLNRNLIGFFECYENLESSDNQFFSLTYYKDIRQKITGMCWDVNSNEDVSDGVVLFYCHEEQGNQLWKYDFEKKWIVHEESQRCLEINVTMDKISLNRCDVNNMNMNWKWELVNVTDQLLH